MVETQEKQVNWNDVMQNYLSWTRNGRQRKLHPVTADAHPEPWGASAEQQIQIPAAAEGDRSERVRSWRRRVLQRRGARMHAAMRNDGANSSLAMLDEDGVVVSWRGRVDGDNLGADHVVGRHVSQFYVPEDIASKQPLRDLQVARVEGSNTRQGWRRGPDGNAFWGTTVIDAVLLRDGRLQGFSYVTRGAEGPPATLPNAQSLNLPRGDTETSWGAAMHLVRFMPARDRMARSRSGARQRRLFRFACQMRMREGDLALSRA